MGLSPLFPGRVPNSLTFERLKSSLQATNANLSRLQDQIASGKQYRLGSENPTSASRTIGLQELLGRKTQVETNIQTSKTLLSATETALASLSDVLNNAQQIASAGIGDSSSDSEKAAYAELTQSLLKEAVNIGNTTFGGRYLFGGSQTGQPPFSLTADGAIRYNGDQQSIGSFVDIGLVFGNNIDGHAAFGALTQPVGSDVNPALSLQTQLADLLGGLGVQPGQISVTLVNGAVTQTQTIDLSAARTVGDLKALVEQAFGAGDVTVSINATDNGLSFVPAAGTVEVAEVVGGTTATRLGIASGPVAQITGADLNPRLSLTTPLSALNGGAGIGALAGNGIQIINGSINKVIDLSSANTVEDVLNLLNAPDLGLSAGINAAGNGFSVSTRLSGVSFSIGENGGTEATSLGIRTLNAQTALSDLNFGAGVPLGNGQTLDITLRDGSVVNLDLTGAQTVQDVLDIINAVSPGHLVASLNAVGNGITLNDDSGPGVLSVEGNALATSLGLGGSAADPQPLTGKDSNPLEVHGTFNVLANLLKGLNARDNAALTRVGGLASIEQLRLIGTQGSLGAQLKTLGNIDTRVKEQKLQLQQSISENYDTDLTSAITDLVNQQTILQAALKSAAQTMQLSLYNYL